MSWAGEMSPGQATGPAPRRVPPELLVRPRTRGNVVFTLIVTLGLLVGGSIMALVLLASDAPGAIVVGSILAVLPVGPLIACYLWLDRYEPEPLRLLVAAFAWGAFVATGAALILQSLDQWFIGTSDEWSAAIVAPITEEATKGLFVVLLLWFRRHELDGVLDGLVYAGLVGVGFAFTENILYLSSAYIGGDGFGPGGFGSATGLFVVRGIFSPFAHPLFSSCIGIGVGIAVMTRKPALRLIAPVVGYVLAVALHAAWNGTAFFYGGSYFLLTYLFAMVPAFLFMVALAVWVRRREARLLTSALQEAASRGLLPTAEIPWLVGLQARRAARKNAAAVGGAEAEQAMRAYQQSAIELGFLHHRYLRGTLDDQLGAHGNQLVEHLRALRPYVVFPYAPAVGGPR